MASSVNSLVSVSDYNTIYNTVLSVMGAGNVTYGYGQPVYSSSKSEYAIISQSDWDLLRYDLLNAITHQSGSASLTEINEHQLISQSIIGSYETLSTQSVNNRFNVANGQFLTVGANTDGSVLTSSKTFNGTTFVTPGVEFWRTEISCTLTVTFASANQARYFFNSGGEVRIQCARSGGAVSGQNTSWTNLLTSIGLKSFGGQTPTTGTTPMDGTNFYKLTSTFQSFYSGSSSTPYASNRLQLEAACNVANNSGGTATIVYIKVRFIDGYTDPGPGGTTTPPGSIDANTGTFSVSVTEKRATGALQPTGTFTITRPTYSISALSGS